MPGPRPGQGMPNRNYGFPIPFGIGRRSFAWHSFPKRLFPQSPMAVLAANYLLTPQPTAAPGHYGFIDNTAPDEGVSS